MAWLHKKSERKSLLLTSILSIALVFALFYFGLSYMEPPEENGIAINLGYNDQGMGDIQPQSPPEMAPQPETQPSKNTEKEVEEAPSESETTDEKVITQETEEAPVIKKKEEEKKKVEKVSEEEKEKPKPKPKPSSSTTQALQSLLNGKKQEGESHGGEGDDNINGDKGDPSGDPKASSYYGAGKGLDGDGNYRLGGRKALNKKKFVQECNESGIVVVKIKVNRQGKVVMAKAGEKGTTNKSSCLLDPAKRSALATRFNPDSNAPEYQIGYIIYEFKLSE